MSHHRLWLRNADTREFLLGCDGRSTPNTQLALGQPWAREAFRSASEWSSSANSEHQPRPKRVKPLRNPKVGDVVVSTSDIGPGAQRILETDKQQLMGKIAVLDSRLSGAWETRQDIADLRRQRAALNEERSVVCAKLERLLGERRGHGVVVPNRGHSVGIDGGVTVKWDDGRIVTYYRTSKEGYPFALAQKSTGGSGAHAKAAQRNTDVPSRPGTSAGVLRAASDVVRVHGDKTSSSGWTLVLGLNALVVPGEYEKRLAARAREAKLKRFVRVWRNVKVQRAFLRWSTFRRPQKFCLLTLAPLGIESEDTEQQFYRPLAGQLLYRPSLKKPNEWQRALIDNGMNPQWLQMKKEAFEESIKRNRRQSVLDVLMQRKDAPLELSPRLQPEDVHEEESRITITEDDDNIGNQKVLFKTLGGSFDADEDDTERGPLEPVGWATQKPLSQSRNYSHISEGLLNDDGFLRGGSSLAPQRKVLPGYKGGVSPEEIVQHMIYSPGNKRKDDAGLTSAKIQQQKKDLEEGNKHASPSSKQVEGSRIISSKLAGFLQLQ